MITLGSLLLAFLIALAVAAAWLGLVKRMGPGPAIWRIALVTVAHTLFCLVLLLGLNAFAGRFGQNEQGYTISAELTSHNAPPSGRPFILIDNSGDKELLPDPLGNEEDSTSIVLTDRRKLTRLFHLLANEQAAIAHVVCDITFVDSTAHDVALRNALLPLVTQGKLMLARGPVPNCRTLTFNDTVMADATEELQSGLIAWHRLVKNGRPGIPYALYQRLRGSSAKPLPLGFLQEIAADGGTSYAFPGFMPTWDHLPAPPVRTDALAPATGTSSDDGPVPIGFAAGAGWSLVQARIHGAGPVLPVVFIGDFPRAADAGTDMHRTFSGTHYGGHLLISLFHDLDHGAHIVRGGLLLFEGIMLLLCTLLVFAKAWYPWASAGRWDIFPKTTTEPTTAGLMARFLWKSFLGTLPLLVFLASAVVLHFCFGQYANLGVLVVHFAMLNALFGHLHKFRWKEKKDPPVGIDASADPPPLGGA